MQLVIGLGNPGPRYDRTRHNIGFRVIDALAGRVDAVFTRRRPQYAEAILAGPSGPVVLLKPLTYMNLSGEAVAAWLADAGADVLPPVLVVCDDIHLPLGTVRLRARGSAGGQKGLASILDTLGSLEVPRLRLGVGPDDDAEAVLAPEDWADFVLAEFTAEEAEMVDTLVARAVAAVLDCLADGPEVAGSRHNGR